MYTQELLQTKYAELDRIEDELSAKVNQAMCGRYVEIIFSHVSHYSGRIYVVKRAKYRFSGVNLELMEAGKPDNYVPLFDVKEVRFLEPQEEFAYINGK